MGEPDDAPPMDPRIWGCLPSELCERVVARLPLTAVLRFRAVCRRWNRLPFHNDFSQLHAAVPSPPSFLKTDIDCSGNALCIENSGKYRTIPFDFFPFLSGVCLRASGGGLLLFSEKRDVPEFLYVCNPITKTWRVLQGPTLPTVCDYFVDVDHSTREFKVVAVGWIDQSTDTGASVEVYYSKRMCWESKGTLWIDDLGCLYGSMWVNGTLYLAVESHALTESAGFDVAMVAVKVEEELTREVFDGLGASVSLYCMGEYRGSLAVVSEIDGNGLIEIWQLQTVQNRGNHWVRLGRLSRERSSQFLTGRVTIAGGVVCFYTYENDQPVALYDLQDRTWRWVDIPSGRKVWFGTPPLAFQASFFPLESIE